MNYKGYNIAVHEMEHNVEQVFSLEMIDHTPARLSSRKRLHRGAGFCFSGA